MSRRLLTPLACLLIGTLATLSLHAQDPDLQITSGGFVDPGTPMYWDDVRTAQYTVQNTADVPVLPTYGGWIPAANGYLVDATDGFDQFTYANQFYYASSAYSYSDSELRAAGSTDGWQAFATSLPAGNHTVCWVFRKDGSVSSGDDAVWVQDISYTDADGNTQTFDFSDGLPAGWSTFGDADWFTESGALRSGDIGDSQYCGIWTTIETNAAPDNLQFSYQTSTEGGYDFLNFGSDRMLGPESSVTREISFVVPNRAGGGEGEREAREETLYPGFWVDPNNQLTESDEQNNQFIGQTPATVLAPDLPDLTVSNVNVSENPTAWWRSVTVNCTVSNVGAAPSGTYYNGIARLSEDSVYDTNDPSVGNFSVGSTNTFNGTSDWYVVNTNVSAGTRVFTWVIYNQSMAEDDTESFFLDEISFPTPERGTVTETFDDGTFDFGLYDADTNPTGWQFWGDASWAITDAAEPGPGPYSGTDCLQAPLPDPRKYAYLSTTREVADGILTYGVNYTMPEHYRVYLFVDGVLLPGQSMQRQFQAGIPYYEQAPVDRELFVAVNPEQNDFPESDATNNTASLPSPLAIDSSPAPDFELSNVTVSENPTSWGNQLDVSYDVTNVGDVAMQGVNTSWAEQVHLSEDTLYEGADHTLINHYQGYRGRFNGSYNSWQQYNYSVPPGTHVFTWAIRHYSDTPSDAESVYLDEIAFPTPDRGTDLESFDDGVFDLGAHNADTNPTGWMQHGGDWTFTTGDPTPGTAAGSHCLQAPLPDPLGWAFISTTREVAEGNVTFYMWRELPANYDLLFYVDGVLLPGQSYTRTHTLTVPTFDDDPHTRYLIASVNPDGANIPEVNTENNVALLPDPLVVNGVPAPDLQVTDAQFLQDGAPDGDGNFFWGNTRPLKVRYKIENTGTADVPVTQFSDRLYLYDGSTYVQTIATYQDYHGQRFHTSLPPTSAEWHQATVTIPAGKHRLRWRLYRTSYGDAVTHGAYLDDVSLTVGAETHTENFDAATIPALPGANGIFTNWGPVPDSVEWTTTDSAARSGTQSIGIPTIDRYAPGEVTTVVDLPEDGELTFWYKLDFDTNRADSLTLIVDDVLDAGGFAWREVQATLTAASTGDFTVRIQTNNYGNVNEYGNGDNNSTDFPISLTTPPMPDLQVDGVSVNANPTSWGQELVTDFSVTNVGGEPTPPGNYWYERVRLSEDGIVDGNDEQLTSRYVSSTQTYSGVSDWYQYTHNVTPGTHVFTWVVANHNDYPVSDGSFYIDEIAFPTLDRGTETETFDTGSLDFGAYNADTNPDGWIQSGPAQWIIVEGDRNGDTGAGTHCLQSPHVAPGQASFFTLTRDVAEGQMTFYLRRDVRNLTLYFYIDGLLVPGQSCTRSLTATVPSYDTSPLERELYVTANWDTSMPEAVTDNNVDFLDTPLTIESVPSPDLQVTEVQFLQSGAPDGEGNYFWGDNPRLHVRYKVENTGTEDVTVPIRDNFALYQGPSSYRQGLGSYSPGTDNRKFRDSRTTQSPEWVQARVTLLPGTHTLRWRFYRGQYYGETHSAFVDDISLTMGAETYTEDFEGVTVPEIPGPSGIFGEWTTGLGRDNEVAWQTSDTIAHGGAHAAAILGVNYANYGELMTTVEITEQAELTFWYKLNVYSYGADTLDLYVDDIIPANGSVWREKVVTPGHGYDFTDGDYQIRIDTDSSGDVQEYNGEDNNITYTDIAFVDPPSPDLEVSNVGVSQNPTYWGAQIGIDYTISNLGSTPTGLGWYEYAYLSEDQVAHSGDDTYLGNRSVSSQRSLNGVSDWYQYSHAVSAGTHVFTWVLRSNSPTPSASARFYLDEIALPTPDRGTDLENFDSGTFSWGGYDADTNPGGWRTMGAEPWQVVLGEGGVGSGGGTHCLRSPELDPYEYSYISVVRDTAEGNMLFYAKADSTYDYTLYFFVDGVLMPGQSVRRTVSGTIPSFEEAPLEREVFVAANWNSESFREAVNGNNADFLSSPLVIESVPAPDLQVGDVTFHQTGAPDDDGNYFWGNAPSLTIRYEIENHGSAALTVDQAATLRDHLVLYQTNGNYYQGLGNYYPPTHANRHSANQTTEDPEWVQATVTLLPGTHRLRWNFYRGAYYGDAHAVYVDNIQLTVGGTTYTQDFEGATSPDMPAGAAPFGDWMTGFGDANEVAWYTTDATAQEGSQCVGLAGMSQNQFGNLTTTVDLADEAVLTYWYKLNVYGTGYDTLTLFVDDFIEPGGSTWRELQTTVTNFTDGEYRVGVHTDNYDNVEEYGNEDNNESSRIPISLTAPPLCDLIVSNIVTMDAGATIQGTFNVSYNLQNIGPGTVPNINMNDKFWLVDATDPEIIYPITGSQWSNYKSVNANGLETDATMQVDATFTIGNDVPEGEYHLHIVTDCYYSNNYAGCLQGTQAVPEALDYGYHAPGYLPDATEGNNLLVSDTTVSISVETADMQVSNVRIPAGTQWGSTFDLTFALANVAPGDGFANADATESISVTVYVSRGDASWQWAGNTSVADDFAVGDSGDYTVSVTVPDYYEEADFRIIISCGSEVGQFAPNNNTLVTDTFALDSPPLPDLVVDTGQDVVLPTQIGPHGRHNFSWHTANQQPPADAPVSDYAYDGLYISTDNDFATGTDNQHLFSRLASNNLEAGASVEVNYTTDISLNRPPGTYYWFVRNDVNNSVPEKNDETLGTDNNTYAGGSFEMLTLDLEPINLVVPSQIQTDGNEISYTVRNNGTADYPDGWSFYEQIYLSTSAYFDPGTATVWGGAWYNGGVGAGETYNRTVTLDRPNIERGFYYVFVRIDSNNNVYEYTQDGQSADDNNVLRRLGQVEVIVPDLVVRSIDAPETMDRAHRTSVTYTLKNQNSGNTGDNWYDRIYLVDQASTPHEIANLWHNASIAPGEEAEFTVSFDVPHNMALGTYRVRVVTDASGHVTEADENNNTLTYPTDPQDTRTVEVRACDLVPTALTSMPAVMDNAYLSVQVSVDNIGAGYSPTGWYTRIYVSDIDVAGMRATYEDMASDSSTRTAQPWISVPGGLAPGDTHVCEFNNVIRVQEAVDANQDGLVFVYATVDISHNVSEYNDSENAEANNRVRRDGPVLIGNWDLVLTTPSDATGTDTFGPVRSGQQDVELNWSVQNNGNAVTGGTWQDRVYLSTNTSTNTNGDTFLGYANRPVDLEPGASYDSSLLIDIPEWRSEWEGQTLYIKILTDYYNSLQEQEEGNNLGVYTLDLNKDPAPDLIVDSVENPGVVDGGQTIALTYTLTNQGDAPARGHWQDRLDLIRVSTGHATYLGARDQNRPTHTEGATNGWTTTPVSVDIPAGRHTLAWVFTRQESYSNLDNMAAMDNIVLPLVGGDETYDFENGNMPAGFETLQAEGVTPWQVNNGVIETPSLERGQQVVLLYTGDFEQGQVQFDANIDAHYLYVFADYGIPAGESRTYSHSVTIPANLDSENYTFRVITDNQNAIDEPGYEDNNSAQSTEFSLNPAPYADLKITTIDRISPVNNDDVVTGGLVSVQWTVLNQNDTYTGTTVTTDWRDSVYLSNNNTLNTSEDPKVAEITQTDNVADGQSVVGEATFRLPDSVTGGTKYVFVVTDTQNAVYEGNPDPTTNVSEPLQLVITAGPYPDLVPMADEIDAPDSIDNGSTFPVYWKVENVGTDPLTGEFIDNLYLSEDDILSGNDIFLGKADNVVNALPPTPLGGDPSFYTALANVTISREISGRYYLILSSDHSNRIFELDEANNTIAQPIDITVAPSANLIVRSAQIEDIGQREDDVTQYHLMVQWTIENIGTGSTGTAQWVDDVYLCTTDTQYGDKTRLLRVNNQAYLEPGETYTQTDEIVVPWEFAEGNYYLLINTDAQNSVYEFQGEADNWGSGTTSGGDPVHIEMRIEPRPYLSICSSYTGEGPTQHPDAIVSPPQNGVPDPHDILITKEVYAPGERIEFNLTSRNTGDANTESAGWDDAVVLSVDPFYDRSGDVWLGSHMWHRAESVLPPYRNRLGQVNEAGQHRHTNNLVTEAPIPTNQPPGEYYLLFISDTHGIGTSRTGGGWSSRDTRGNVAVYRNRITVEERVPSDLILADGSVQTDNDTYQTNSPMSVSWRVENRGFAATRGAWHDYVYLSTNDTAAVTAGDHRIASVRNPKSLEIVPTPETANENWFYDRSVSYDIPIRYVNQETQFYVKVVCGNGENETYAGSSNKDNNFGIMVSPITITTFPPADLEAMSVSITTPADQVKQGYPLSVQWTVRNSPDAPVPTNVDTWTDHVYYYVGDNADALVAANTVAHRGALEPGEQYTREIDFPLPENIGSPIRVVIKAAGGNRVYEADRENNTYVSTPTEVAVLERPDLAVTDHGILLGPSFPSGSSLTYTYTVTNAATNDTWPTRQSWHDRVYLSRDAILDASDPEVASHERRTGLAAGDSYTVQKVIDLGIDMSGDYHLFVVTDASDHILELNEVSNNHNRANPDPFTVTLTGTADIQVTAIDLSGTDPLIPFTEPDGAERTSLVAGQRIDGIQYSVANLGDEPTGTRTWVDVVYLSRDTQLDQRDTRVATVRQTRSLAAAGQEGDSYTSVADIQLPRGLGGDFFLLVRADDSNSVYERGAENNNVAAVGANDYFNVIVPHHGDPTQPATNYDLRVSDVVVSLPPGRDDLPVQPGHNFHVAYTLANHGTGSIERARWTDGIYLSTDADWDIADEYIGSIDHVGSLQANAGSQIHVEREFLMPAVDEDLYYVVVRTDIRQDLTEADEYNNATATAEDNRVNTEIPHLDDDGDPDVKSVLADQTAVTRDIVTEGEYYFRVDVEAGRDLMLDLTCTDPASFTELFARYDSVPSPVTADYFFANHFQPDQRIVIPGTTAGSYYILVRGDHVPGAETGAPTFTLTVKYLEFESETLTPDFGGNNGRVTIRVEGAKFTTRTQATLIAPDSSEYPAVDTFFHKPTSLYATFDLTGAPVGEGYDLRLTDPQNAQLDGRAVEHVNQDCFQVTQGLGGNLTYRIIAPATVRPTGKYFAWIEYGNNGDQDIAAPLLHFTVDNPAGFLARISPNDPWRSKYIQVLGINQDGPADRLPPGSRYAIPISFRIPETGRKQLQLRILDSRTELFDYEELRDELDNGETAEEHLDRMMEYLQEHYGPIFATFAQGLREDALRLWRQDRVTSDVRKLIEFAANRGFQNPVSSVTGFLRNQETGALLTNAPAVLLSPGGRIYSDRSNALGEFAFHNVTPGVYKLFVDGYLVQPEIEVEINLDEDHIGIFAEAVEAGEQDVPITTPHEAGDTRPALCNSPSGHLHLVWSRGEFLWHAAWSDQESAWSEDEHGVEGSPIVWETPDGVRQLVRGSKPQMIAFANADPDADEADRDGVIVLYEAGIGAPDSDFNDRHFKYVLGRPERDDLGDPTGEFEWTQPYTMTSGDYGDSQGTAVKLPGSDTVLMLYLQRDWSDQDDTDLYYKTKEITGVETDTYPADLRLDVQEFRLDLGRDAENTDTFSVGFNRESKTKLPSWLPLIGGKYGYKVAGNLNMALQQCSVEGAFDVGVEIDVSDNVSFSGSVGGSAKWESNKKVLGEDCEWLFKEAKLSLSGGGSFNIPGWTGSVAVASWEIGVNISPSVSVDMEWEGSNFPGWPSNLKGSFTVSVGPYGKVELFGGAVEIEVQGSGFVTLAISTANGIEPAEYGFKVGASASCCWVTASWEKEWKWSSSRTYDPREISMGTTREASDDRLVIRNTDIRGGVYSREEITYTKEGLVGTTNLYLEDDSLLLEDADAVATDRQIDAMPSVATSAGGEILAVWAKNSGNRIYQTGSYLKCATYDPGADEWTVHGDIATATDMNCEPVALYDSNDVPWVFWIQADMRGININDPVEEAVEAMGATSIMAVRRVNRGWSAPMLIAQVSELEGSHASPSIAVGPEGALTVAWVNRPDTTGANDRILVRTYDATADTWTDAEAISVFGNRSDTKPMVSNPSAGYSGATPVVTWIHTFLATVDEGDGTVEVRRLASSYHDGAEWSGPAFFDKPLPTARRYAQDQMGRQIELTHVEAEAMDARYAPVDGDRAADRTIAIPFQLTAECCECPKDKEKVEDECKDKCEGGKVRNDQGDCECPEGMKEDENGECVPECPEGQEMVDGECVDKCPEGQERVNGECKEPCPEGQSRNAQGECEDDPPPCPDGQCRQDDGSCADCPDPDPDPDPDPPEPNPPGPPDDGHDTDSSTSADPNEKHGTPGFGEQNLIPADKVIAYTIMFENMPEATSPASLVTITDVLPEGLDMRRFRLGEFAFSGTVIEGPENSPFFTKIIDLENGMKLRVSGGISPATREARWEFRTIDPTTGEQPVNPNDGFLPINTYVTDEEGNFIYKIDVPAEPYVDENENDQYDDGEEFTDENGNGVWDDVVYEYERETDGTLKTDENGDPIPAREKTGIGEGHVTFTILPDAGVVTDGSVIENEATIVFDTNEAIVTNRTMHTITTNVYDSTVEVVGYDNGAQVDADTITVAWSMVSGEIDFDAEGAGYDIYMSEGDSAFRLWLAGTTQAHAELEVQRGLRYRFFSLVHDAAGVSEPRPASPDAFVRILHQNVVFTGDVVYAGREPGAPVLQIYADTKGARAFTGDLVDTPTISFGNYTSAALPGEGKVYNLRAWIDQNGNGSPDPYEAYAQAADIDPVGLATPIYVSLAIQDIDSDQDRLPDWWEQQHFGNLDATTYGDPDDDGVPNVVEYNRGTDPNDADDAPVKEPGTGAVQVGDDTLYVDGSEFRITGAIYRPVAPGTLPGAATSYSDANLTRDLPKFARLGANTLHAVARIADHRLLDYSEALGLKVILGFPIPSDADLEDDAVREELIQQFAWFVQEYHDHAALLMWSIGGSPDQPGWYDMVSLLAWTAYDLEGDAYHPITATRPLATFEVEDVRAAGIDMWAVPHVGASDFSVPPARATLFEEYAALNLGVPMYVAGFGVDAWDSDHNTTNAPRQARTAVQLWRAIEAVAPVGGIYQASLDAVLAGDPAAGIAGIPGSLSYTDANGNARRDHDEPVWSDVVDSVFERYEHGFDTVVSASADDAALDGCQGVAGLLSFRDENGNLRWDDGEVVWADLQTGETIAEARTAQASLFDAGVDVMVVGDAPDDGELGRPYGLAFCDANADGVWNPGELAWFDEIVGSEGVFDDGIDLVLDGTPAAGAAGIGTGLYFEDADGNGRYTETEAAWSKGATQCTGGLYAEYSDQWWPEPGIGAHNPSADTDMDLEFTGLVRYLQDGTPEVRERIVFRALRREWLRHDPEPFIGDTRIVVEEDQEVSFFLQTFGEGFTYHLVRTGREHTGGLNGNVVNDSWPADGEGLVTYRPDENFVGTDRVDFEVMNDSREVVGSGQVIVEVTNVNDAPTVVDLGITPDVNATEDDALAASYTYVDVDGDEETGTVIKWFRNSEEQTSLANEMNVPAANTVRSDAWQFSVVPSDGQLAGDEQYGPLLTLVNRPSFAADITLGHAGYFANEDVSVADYTFGDADTSDLDNEDGSQLVARWYRMIGRDEELLVQLTGPAALTLPAGYGEPGDQVFCRIWPSDGDAPAPDTTTTGQSPVVSLANYVETVTVSPGDARTGDDLSYNLAWRSLDVDTPETAAVWDRDGAPQSHGATVPSAETARGQTWTATVTSTIDAGGTPRTSPPTTGWVTIQDTPPPAPSGGGYNVPMPTVPRDVWILDVAEGTDADLDPITLEYQWGRESADGSIDWNTNVSGQMLPGGVVGAQDDWVGRVRASASDGSARGIAYSDWRQFDPLRFGERMTVHPTWNLVSLPYNNRFQRDALFSDDWGTPLQNENAWYWNMGALDYLAMSNDHIVPAQAGFWVYSGAAAAQYTRPMRGANEAGTVTLYHGWNLLGPRALCAVPQHAQIIGDFWYWNPAVGMYQAVDNNTLYPFVGYWVYFEATVEVPNLEIELK